MAYRAALRTVVALCLSPMWFACSDYEGTGPYAAPPGAMYDIFIAEGGPYEVLLRDCAFIACHGAEERFFQIYGPGRRRLVPEKDLFDPTDINEAGPVLSNAKEFIDPEDPARSMLLRKPLAISAGGTGHGGVDVFGRDVYPSDNADGYRILARWVAQVRR